MAEMKFLNKKQNFTLAAQRAYQPELETHSVSTASNTVQKNKQKNNETSQPTKQTNKKTQNITSLCLRLIIV